MTAPDGTPLERIENIPNVTCDEQETSVGKICYARPELVAQLRTLSEKELAPNGEKIVITQAFRTRDIQMALYKKACSEGCDCSSGDCEFARNPDKLTNPSGHMGGTAIDAIVSDSAGNELNGDGGTNPAGAEKIMCMNNEGFVRWKKESWHFEYGSYNWGKAEELRTEGKTVCSFPS
jgi:D-alanyl-D-alanine dipeptidase